MCTPQTYPSSLHMKTQFGCARGLLPCGSFIFASLEWWYKSACHNMKRNECPCWTHVLNIIVIVLVYRMHNLKMRKMRIGSCLKESFARMGLTEACTFVHDDAKFVNEMTQNDLVLLSLGVMRSDTRAYQDIAILESEFLEFDARVREDIEKSIMVWGKRLNVFIILLLLWKTKQSILKSAADKYWSDWALETDLHRAYFCAKQWAMKDALMALEFGKYSWHDGSFTLCSVGATCFVVLIIRNDAIEYEICHHCSGIILSSFSYIVWFTRRNMKGGLGFRMILMDWLENWNWVCGTVGSW